jgi:predicted dehydrogenase
MIRLGFADTHEILFDLIPALRESDSFQITGIYSVNEKVLFEISDKLLIQPVIIPETLFMRSDAIMVVGDPANYYDFLVKCLQYSKHIFLRSLGNLTSKQIETLIKLATEGQVVIYTASRLGFLDCIENLRNSIQKPFMVEITAMKAYKPGIFLNQDLRKLTMNSVEVLLNINPAGILKLQPNAASVSSELTDFIHVRVDFANGCFANICNGLISAQDEFKVKVIHRGGVVEMDILNEVISSTKLVGGTRVESKKSFVTEMNSLIILNRDLKRFHELVLKSESEITSLEESYSAVLLTSRIFEKAQIPVLTENEG